MRLIDAAFLECPYYGARQMARMGLSPSHVHACDASHFANPVSNYVAGGVK
jgi:hypothetical protein